MESNQFQSKFICKAHLKQQRVDQNAVQWEIKNSEKNYKSQQQDIKT